MTVVALHLLACFYSEILAAQTYIISGTTYNYISLTPLNIFFNGSFSVYIFWTISGFLIANSWYSKHDLKDMQKKVLNKYFRVILPIALATVIAFVLVELNLYYNVQAGELINNSFFTNESNYTVVTLSTVLRDLLRLDFWNGSSAVLIPPLWTMKTEMIGSWMTALLLILFGDKKHRHIVWALLVFFSIKAYVVYVCFLTGIILAEYYKTEKKIPYFWGVLAVVVGIVLGSYPPSGIPQSGIYEIVYRCFVVNYNEFLGVMTGVHFMYVVAAALIIFGCLNCSGIQKMLSTKIFLYLGERSFYVYILHMPIIMSATAWIFIQVFGNTENYELGVVISCSATLVLCLLFSEVFKRISEKWLNPASARIVQFFNV